MKNANPKFIITSPHGQKTEFPLTEEQIGIGRAEQNRLVLFDERASRNHALVIRSGDTFSLKDLGSRNGTYLNGVEMKKGDTRALVDGDEVKIGNFRLLFKLPDKRTTTNLDYDDRPIGGTVRLQSAADLLRSALSSGDATSMISGTMYAPLRSGGGFSSPSIEMLSVPEIEVLAKRSRILGLIYDLNKSLNRLFTAEEIFEKVADLTFKVSNGGRIVFATVNEGEVEIQWGKYRDEFMAKKYDGIPVSRTIIRKVISDRVSLLSVDPMADPGLMGNETFRFGKIRSVMCAPLIGQDETALGAMYVDRPESIGFTDEDLNFLTAVANNAALTLENIRTHEKLVRDAQARQAYMRFMPQHVVDQIMAHPENLVLGGVSQIVTMFFADIRGFTTLSERKSPQEIVVLLNNYFERAAAAIFKHNGTLDKFIGDGIMALFGAPTPSEADAINAIHAAIALQREVLAVNAELKTMGSDFQISIGIGINTGEVIAGYIGSKLRTDYTVIGDAVNLAARLESNAKPGQILIGDKTYALVRAYMMGLGEAYGRSESQTAWTDSGRIRDVDFVMRPMGGLKVKGKTKSVQVYQVLWDDSLSKGGTLEPADPAATVAADPQVTPAATVDPKERRKEPRVNLCFKLRVSGVDVEGVPFESECLTEDVSMSGACLQMDREVRVGHIVLVRGVDRLFQVQAEIRSVRQVGKVYKTGVQYTSSYPIWQIK